MFSSRTALLLLLLLLCAWCSGHPTPSTKHRAPNKHNSSSSSNSSAVLDENGEHQAHSGPECGECCPLSSEYYNPRGGRAAAKS